MGSVLAEVGFLLGSNVSRCGRSTYVCKQMGSFTWHWEQRVVNFSYTESICPSS